MASAYFYHLTYSSLAQTIGLLAPKALSAGWRVEVRGRLSSTLKQLDDALWQKDDFLPHAISGGKFDADQPILLTDKPSASGSENKAECLMGIEGVEIALEEIPHYKRVCILFDGHDPDAVSLARQQWKNISSAGIHAQYWAQSEGTWVQKASANAK